MMSGVKVTAGEVYFVEIINSIVETTTWFWEWGFSANGDNLSFQKAGGLDYALYDREPTDLAFCLNIELADVQNLCVAPDAEPCELEIAGVDLEEGEPCGQEPDKNTGCSVQEGDPPGPFTFFAISTDPANPTVIHGESWADDGTRDIDWYQFDAPDDIDANEDGEVTVCLSIVSELPMAAVVVVEDPLDPLDCADPDIPAADAIGFECGASLAVGYGVDYLAEGQLILVRSSDGLENFFGFPCDDPEFGNDYLMEVAVVDVFDDCFPVVDPCACPWDLNGDGVTGVGDLLILFATWGPCPGDPGCPDCPGDFNADGFIGVGDMLAMFANWGLCP